MSLTKDQLGAVKDLNAKTGAGLSACKKALEAGSFDVTKAEEYLMRLGRELASKRAGKVSVEGLVGIKLTADGTGLVAVEVNCETDFVAKTEKFVDIARRALDAACQDPSKDVAAISEDIEQSIADAAVSLHEKIALRRVESISGQRLFKRVYESCANGSLGRIAVGIALDGDGGGQIDEIGARLALHVLANPVSVLSTDNIEKELHQAKKQQFVDEIKVSKPGVPDELLDKILQGKLNAWYASFVLLEQPFFKGDGKQTVRGYLDKSSVRLVAFMRLKRGENIGL